MPAGGKINISLETLAIFLRVLGANTGLLPADLLQHFKVGGSTSSHWGCQVSSAGGTESGGRLEQVETLELVRGGAERVQSACLVRGG